MLLYPNENFKSVDQITLEFLKSNKIKALILDVDNTLIDYDRNMSKKVIEWSNLVQSSGIKLYILSNTNKKDKVIEVAKKLNIDKYKFFAKKPLKCGFKKAIKDLNEKNENIAVVGDQIFTDILGGNRLKLFTILVEPINEKDIFITKVKRPIENLIINNYLKEKQKRDVGK